MILHFYSEASIDVNGKVLIGYSSLYLFDIFFNLS